MGRKREESRQALGKALLAWGIITVLVGIGLIVADYFVTNEYVSLGLMSLSSAALSIAGALLITEWLIKPLYVRDVLEVANLSSEVHNAGLRQLRRSQSVAWADVLSGGGQITAVAGSENLFRSGPWLAIMAAGRLSKREVRVHISEALAAAGFASTLERQWRDNGCTAHGSTLSVVPHDTLTQGLVLQCDGWTAASVADDPLNDDPPILLFAAHSDEPLVSSLRRGVARLNESSITPISGA